MSPPALAVVVLVLAVLAPAPAITLPAGFTDELVTALGAPTALAFTPDGRLLITTQSGRLRVYENDTLLGTAALDLSGQAVLVGRRGADAFCDHAGQPDHLHREV